MAYVQNDYPLYYDAVNEKGIGIAGLNFPGNAYYQEYQKEKDNIASFELIPWVLGQCADLDDVIRLLEGISIWKVNFSEKLPTSPLHWMISYRDRSLTEEAVKDGLNIFENPVGILTNNPPFDYQMFHLTHFLQVSPEQAVNRFSKKLELNTYSLGMGGIGLPGDLSSMSRFVKASFTKMNAVSGDSESESISQFFHLLGSVEFPRGCVEMKKDIYEITVYSSCCNTDKGIYYYKTYENFCITAVDMHHEDLDGTELVCYPMEKEMKFDLQN
jgi:choloylglycine hydrolase